MNQQYTIPFANKRIVVDRIATSLAITRRKQWGAKQPDYATMVGDWDYTDVVIHHSGNSGETDPKEIEEEHMEKWEDVGYHYLIPPMEPSVLGLTFLFRFAGGPRCGNRPRSRDR